MRHRRVPKGAGNGNSPLPTDAAPAFYPNGSLPVNREIAILFLINTYWLSRTLRLAIDHGDICADSFHCGLDRSWEACETVRNSPGISRPTTPSTLRVIIVPI